MATLEWEFTSAEIDAVRGIVAERCSEPFVASRREGNVAPAETTVSESRFWNAHLASLLTSRQRSGPDSRVFRFLQDERETLCLERCRDADDVSKFVSETLEEFGGILYYNNIGTYCAKNLERLDDGGWDRLRDELDQLIRARKREPTASDATAEREVSRFLHRGFDGDGLHGIGPKQSRNLLQILGLTRYETPLDSRITRWLNERLEFPYEITGGGLSEPEYYAFVMDLVQDVCAEADVLPCIFDAAVFSSYDDGWSEDDASVTF